MGVRRRSYFKDTPEIKNSSELNTKAKERIHVLKDNGEISLQSNEAFYKKSVSPSEEVTCYDAVKGWYVLIYDFNIHYVSIYIYIYSKYLLNQFLLLYSNDTNLFGKEWLINDFWGKDDFLDYSKVWFKKKKKIEKDGVPEERWSLNGILQL